MTTAAMPQNAIGLFSDHRGSSGVGAAPAPHEGHHVTDTLPFAGFRPVELAPDQRVAAVAAALLWVLQQGRATCSIIVLRSDTQR